MLVLHTRQQAQAPATSTSERKHEKTGARSLIHSHQAALQQRHSSAAAVAAAAAAAAAAIGAFLLA